VSDTEQLLEEIRALEVELHHPGVRCDLSRLESLLHPDFQEFGRSGTSYDRPTVLRFLLAQLAPPSVLSDHFAVSRLADDIVLLTYRSAHRRPDDTLEHHTLRSSVWVQKGPNWQLRWHQGTPAAVPWSLGSVQGVEAVTFQREVLR
jgi:hypothetical protein